MNIIIELLPRLRSDKEGGGRRWHGDRAFRASALPMSKTGIDPNQSVDDVMRRWPATIAVFIRHRMSCVGCPFGMFHSVAESSAQYKIPPAQLLHELNAAAFES